jgi:hypothetical protein
MDENLSRAWCMARKDPPNRELKYLQHDSGFENQKSHGGIGRISSSADNHRNEQAHTSQENIAQGHWMCYMSLQSIEASYSLPNCRMVREQATSPISRTVLPHHNIAQRLGDHSWIMFSYRHPELVQSEMKSLVEYLLLMHASMDGAACRRYEYIWCSRT